MNRRAVYVAMVFIDIVRLKMKLKAPNECHAYDL